MRRISLEEAENRLFNKHGDNIKMSNYIIMDNDAHFVCNVCGHEWNTKAYSVINQGCGCDVCSRKERGLDKRLDYKYVKEYIESFNCKLISPEYISAHKDITVEFSCGHVLPTTYAYFQSGRRCSICKGERMAEKTRKPEINAIKEIEDNGFEFVDFPNGYKNRKSVVRFRCKYGHVDTRKFGDFQRNTGCKFCSRIRLSIEQLGSKGTNWRGGTTKLTHILREQITEWKKESIKNCGYKCIITGKRFKHVHHLYGLNLILSETLQQLGFMKKGEYCNDYSEEELFLICTTFKKNHAKYPLGVCLCKEVHRLFHKIYGSGNNTPDQWYEFVDRVKSGEITIPN